MSELENWVSVAEAAEASGYSKQAVTLLARKRDITAKKIGKPWVIHLPSLLQHKAEMQALGDRRHDPRRNPGWLESKRGK